MAYVSHAHPLPNPPQKETSSNSSTILRNPRGLYCWYAPVFRSRRVHGTVLFYEFSLHDIPDEMFRLSIIHRGHCNRARTFRARIFLLKPGAWGLYPTPALFPLSARGKEKMLWWKWNDAPRSDIIKYKVWLLWVFTCLLFFFFFFFFFFSTVFVLYDVNS